MILLIFQNNEAVLEMNYFRIIPSQTYQAESATRGSLSFFLTVLNENA